MSLKRYFCLKQQGCTPILACATDFLPVRMSAGGIFVFCWKTGGLLKTEKKVVEKIFQHPKSVASVKKGT